MRPSCSRATTTNCAPAEAKLTVVHDYEGVAAWLQGRWKADNPTVATIVEACRRLIRDGGLDISFRYQEAHQSTWVGRDDFAFFNGRADALATEAGATLAD